MAAIVFPQMDGQQEAEAFIRQETAAAKPDDECNAGDAFYVVSNKWFTQWCQYSGFSYDPSNPRRKPRVMAQDQPGPRPGPIDSSDLLAQPPAQSDLTPEQAASVVALRDGLVDKKDFWAVQEVTWNLLKSWYGVAGPEIRRECHPVGRRVQLDVHQQHFRVVVREPAGAGPGGATGQPIERDCVVGASVHCQLSNLKAMACQQLGVDPEDYDIHDYRGLTQGAQLEATSYKTLTGNKLADQQALLLLPRLAAGAAPPASPGGQVPILAPAPPSIITAATSPVGRPLSFSPRYSSPSSPLSRSFDRAPSWAEDAVFPCEGRGHGLAGLGNLGNTCFMNSSLQCLAHSWPLMQTFLSGEYKRDLNRDNPLSLGGKLATAFAALMDKLWRGGVGHVSPKLFKWQLAKFAPQFSGYAQQDSQELLAFLLDGLHEDLNRITDKPYIEDRDSDGRPDEEVAAEAWHNYRRRNDSVIVDAFQYLCRSKLTCPRCQFQSVKFDPLMYLTLPLPSSKKRALTFTVAYIDGSAPPRQYGIELPKSATVGQLYAGIAELVGLATEAPEQVLLLSQFNTSTGDSAVYDDLKARLTALEDFRPRGFFYRSSGPTSLYVAWVYPSPGEGPRSGKQLVQVVHKHRSSYVVPPTPLFIDQQHLAELSTERDLGDSVVQPGGGRDAIDAALAAALRPLRKHADVAPEAPVEPLTSSRMSTDSPGPLLQRQQQQQQQETPQAGVADDGPAPMEEAGQTPAAVAGAGSDGGEGDAMEVEQQQQQQEQQEHRPQEVQQPAGMPNGDEAWLSGAGEAAEGPAEDADVFDMWASQKEDAARAAAAAAAAAASQPLYVLKAAKPNSFNGGFSTYDAKLELPEQPSKPLLLLAEWQEAAAALYDPAPLVASPERDPSAAALAERAKGGGKGATLADCLETFLEEEQLDADESWYCSKCRDHVQADKKLDLWSLPDVLVILLQRFSHSRYSRDKLDTLVHFPLKGLDMSPYLLGRQARAPGGQNGGAPPPPVYELYAVSNHYGSMGGGHYTAYCRMPGDSQDRWYTFDDSHVSEMDASGVQTKAAYVLFYKRQGAEVDLQALLEQHRQQQQQDAADGSRSAGVAPPSVAGGAPASPGADVVAAPPPPPPLPGAVGGSSSTMLGKRQPEMASIGEEVEDGEDEAAIAGPIEIDDI